MKTAIKIIFILLIYSNSFSQKDNIIYIKYDENMMIQNQESEISLSFSIHNKDDKKINTYNFKIDNLRGNFENYSFKQLQDTIVLNKGIRIETIKKLSKYNSCDLHYLLSEARELILIKKEEDIFLKYKLTYWSTQRGWEKMKM